jgi:type I restriction enzyme, S subunit
VSATGSGLPSGWQEVELGKVAQLSGRIGWKGLTAKEYTQEGPLFLSVHSLNYGDYVDFRDAFHINQHRYEESPEIMLRKHDVLICKDGAGIGKVGIVGDLLGETTINSSLLLLRALPSIRSKYLYYILLSPYFQRIVQSRLMGATTPHLYQRDIAEFPILLPPLPEQQDIVDILDEAFAGLTIVTANTERNIKNARELFDSSLNLIFTHKSDAWEQVTLAEVSAQFGRGKSRHRPRNDPSLYGGQYPFIQTGDVRNSDRTIVEYSQTYNDKGLAQSKLWPKGTICITIAANIAETGVLGFDACFPDSVIGMVVNPAKANNKFVEYLLQSFKSGLQAEGKGSAQANINLATFENRRFPMPPITVQAAVAEKLDAIANESQRLYSFYQTKLEAIFELKRSILQKAFSGGLTSPPSSAIKEAAE